jgi:hypothetical protein
MVSPGGSVPAVIVQVYGAVPPPTTIVPVYGVPTVPGGGEVRVNVGAAGLMVRLTGPVVVCCGLLESVALTVM